MLMLSAFFSGMETAFVASNRLKLEIERKQNSRFDYIISIFTKHQGEYITTLLVGNNIALVVYSLNMSLIINLVGERYGLPMFTNSILVETIISTIIIIFVAEFIPKAVVRLNPNGYLKLFAWLVYLFYIVLYPISKLATFISSLIFRLFGLKINKDLKIKSFDKVDLEHLLEEVTEHEEQIDSENEIKILQNALDFSDLKVRDCMVPRVDVEAAEKQSSLKELTDRFLDTKYSRILIYNESIDNIIGYVNSKSLFASPKSIDEIINPIYFVPETLPARRLMGELIKRKMSLAVVIDEFGGTAGLVSLEDILEEIFGDIEDEHDTSDMVERVTAEGNYIFSGRLEVEYLNEKYDLGIDESESYDTLAGYIIMHYGGIPSSGETVIVDNMEIKVLKMSGSKLDLAQIKLL